MGFESDNRISRFPKDFIDLKTAERAGIIEIRIGPSAPLIFETSKYLSFPWPALSINALEYDSRNVSKGTLFFALPGLHTDGHDYINDAVSRGARLIVHQRDLTEQNAGYREGVLYIKVKDSRFAMSSISDSFYNHPSRRLGIIGITGTEGKSTTVYLVYQLLKLLGKKAGFISTVKQSDGITEIWNSEHQTTPEAPIIHRLLDDMCRNGVEYAVVESSSHGLSKKTNRLGDVDFDVGVLTNLRHEHLEFHGTWEQYRHDKAELFRFLDRSPTDHNKKGPAGYFSVASFAVVNADDPSADFFTAATKQKTYSFSTAGTKADLSARFIQSKAEGNSCELFEVSTGKTHKLEDRLPGAFNVDNVLAAILLISKLLNIELEKIIPLVPSLKPVRGRMSPVNRGQPFEVIVDYAHTPSSFEAILPPLKERLKGQGRIICLFGSPGERDTQKRKLQGEVAARYSDIIILSDEDPRGEDPMSILEEIAQSCETTSNYQVFTRDENLFLIPDRPKAVRKAISLARPGDVVLLLGKGHENSIIYAQGPVDYDETREAETALEEAGFVNGTGVNP